MTTRDSFGLTSGLLGSMETTEHKLISECDPCQEDTGMEFGRCLGHSDRTWQLSSVMGIEWLGEGDYRCTELLLSMYS